MAIVNLLFNVVNGASGVLRSIGRGVGALGQQFANLNQTVELFGRGLDAIKSGFGLGPGLTEAGKLEDILARVNSLTKATAEQQVALSAAVNQAALDTRSTVEKAAQALELLAREGLTAEQSIQSLGTVLAFADANATTAASAIGGLNDILGGFGESADQVGALADKLTALSRATGAPVDVLQAGLSKVAVSAEQAGLSLDSALEAIGALATRSIEGGRGGAQLAIILQQLNDPASKAAAALREVGLEGKSFQDTLKALSQDGDAAEKVLSALGAKPRAALQALLQDGGSALNGLRAAIDGASGSTRRLSEDLQKTFLGTLDKLSDSLDIARNEFLKPLLPRLATEFDRLSDKIQEFVDSKQFDNLSRQFSDFVGNGVKDFGDFIAKVDFDEVAASVSRFAKSVGRALDGVIAILERAAKVYDFLASLPGRVAGAVDDVIKKYPKLNAEIEASRKSFEDSAKAQAEAARLFEQVGAAVSGATELLFGVGPAAESAATEVEASADRQKDALEKVPPAAEAAAKATQSASAAAADSALNNEKASDSTERLAKSANNAASANTNNAVAAKESGDAQETAAGQTEQYNSSLQRASEAIGEVSQKFVELNRAALEAAIGGGPLDSFQRRTTEIATELFRQREAFNEAIRAVRDQAAAYDPLAERIRTLRGEFDLLSDSQLRALAQEQEALERVTKAAEEANAAKRTQSSSSAGGGTGQGGRNPNGPGSNFGPNGPGARPQGNAPQPSVPQQVAQGVQPVFNFNLAPGANITPAEAERLVRQLLPTIKRLSAGATSI